MITVSSLVNPQHIPPCIHMYFQTAHKSKFVFYKFHLQIVEGNWQNVTVRYLPTISKRRLESDELREIIKCLIHIITPTVIHIYILKPRANRQILNSLSYVLSFFSVWGTLIVGHSCLSHGLCQNKMGLKHISSPSKQIANLLLVCIFSRDKIFPAKGNAPYN